MKPPTVIDATFLETVRRLNAAGWCDADVALAIGCYPHTASRHRKALGLPSHSRGATYRARLSASIRRSCVRAGVSCPAELRARAYRAFARDRGWPEDLPVPAVLILDALEARGPMTRRQIAEAIGVSWKGSGDAFKNHRRGNYLTLLRRRGLVVYLGRRVRAPGKGRTVGLYAPGPMAPGGTGS